MPSSYRPFIWKITAVGILVLAVALFVLNGKITTWISGDKFREVLNQETSKGLKFQGHYAPLTRVSLLGLHTDSFDGENGTKAIVSIKANDISGWFNPLGIGLRHWELHDLRIKSGTVMIQKTNPTPGEPRGVKPIPWWALFWPYRVELEDVKCDDADVLFKLKDKESGIYHTLLEITPNGRDFEYDGKGGVFRTPLSPQLNLEHIHLLIRKPRLTCPFFILGDDPTHPERQIRITGQAGLQDDRSIDASAQLTSLQVAPWLPEKWRDHVLGHASGNLKYHSSGTGIESATVEGSILIADAVLKNLALIQTYVKLTGSPDPGDLHLRLCQSDVRLDKGSISLENLQVECPGVFKLQGTITLAQDKTIHGEVKIGLTTPYLRWLPDADTTIFTHPDGEYHTTTVHLSGTAKKPVQDLSPRVLKQIEKSPSLALKLFFNAL